MTLHQSEAFLIVSSMLGLFVWGGLRHDVVALLALSAALLVGIVPADKAFLGFASPVIMYPSGGHRGVADLRCSKGMEQSVGL